MLEGFAQIVWGFVDQRVDFKAKLTKFTGKGLRVAVEGIAQEGFFFPADLIDDQQRNTAIPRLCGESRAAKKRKEVQEKTYKAKHDTSRLKVGVGSFVG